MSSHYVYALIDPDNLKPYYVGKGMNGRIKEHFQPSKLKECSNQHKANKIRQIRQKGWKPRKHVTKLHENLTKEAAFELERFIISEIGLENLTNMHEGGGGGIKKGVKEQITGETNKVSKLKDREASEIKWLANNTKIPLKEIAKRYSVSLSVVSHIRIGRTWDHVDEVKPTWYKGEAAEKLTPEEKKQRRRKRASEFKWLANKTDLSYKQIGSRYGVHINTVKRYMRRKADKVESSKPEWYEGAIVDQSKKKEKKREKVARIKWLCKNTEMYQKDIANEYSVKKSWVSDINNERIYEYVEAKEPEWHDEDIETEKGKELRKVSEIKWLAQNSTVEYKYIAENYEKSKHMVGKIKREESWKNVTPKKPSETPIGKKKKRAMEIKWLLSNTEMNHGEIQKKYNIGRSSISHIKTGRTWEKASPKQPGWYSE